MFGAKSENDTDAVNSYALAMGLEPRELADKAARVQAIYKGHRRRMGNWKVQNVKEQAAKTHDFLGNAFAGGSVTVPSTSLQRAKTAMPTAGGSTRKPSFTTEAKANEDLACSAPSRFVMRKHDVFEMRVVPVSSTCAEGGRVGRMDGTGGQDSRTGPATGIDGRSGRG